MPYSQKKAQILQTQEGKGVDSSGYGKASVPKKSHHSLVYSNNSHNHQFLKKSVPPFLAPYI